MATDTTKPYFPTTSSTLPTSSSSHPQTLTPESKFWRSFRSSELTSSSPLAPLPITSLTFSPSNPHLLASTSSTTVHFHNTNAPDHAASSKLPDVAYSASFRCDGALIAAGCQAGPIQVHRPDKPGPPLRILKAHSSASRVVKYPISNDKIHLFSGGDDAVFAYWDVSGESPLFSVSGAHRDYIRAGAASPVSPEVFATGSYDHFVKLWDMRLNNNSNDNNNNNGVLSFSHGAPVESAVFLPSGGLIATAGGNSIKIWDIIGGGRLLHSVESHNKTVTGLALGRISGDDGEESRLLSVSIDGYLKSFDFGRLRITHSMRYPVPLLSVAFSPSGLVRVVGSSNGVIYMGMKKKKDDEEGGIRGRVVSELDLVRPEEEKPMLRTTNYRYFRRGQGEKPGEGDFILSKPKRVKLAEHDKLLKKFRHKDALVVALKGKNPRRVVAVMEELVARRKLVKCVGNLDKDELGMLLGFLHRYATMPRYARFLMGLAKKVLEMHVEEIQSTEELRGHVRNLKRMVAEEIQIQRSLKEIQGMISPLLVIAGR